MSRPRGLQARWARRRRLEVLADTCVQRVCRGCGMPLTLIDTYLRPRRRVALEYAPRVVETSAALDDGTVVWILEAVRVHHCPAAPRTRQEGADAR
jgi:hypothetical protein